MSMIKVSLIQFLVKAISPAWGQPPSFWVLTGQSENALVSLPLLFCEDRNPILGLT